MFVVGDVVTSEISKVIKEYFGHIKLHLSQLREDLQKTEKVVYSPDRPNKTALVKVHLNTLTNLKCQVDGLTNRSLRQMWHRRIDDMQNALDNESTKSPECLSKIIPPKMGYHHVPPAAQFRHFIDATSP